jgi:outer membrane protein assembly factor BamA
VSSIVLEGNTFTKDVVIRRELQFQPGDVLTPEKLDTSEERLRRLPFLSGIEIRTLETDAEQSARTVLVHVDERSPGLFKAGVGVNDDAPNTTLNIKGYVGAGYRNLGGTGRELTARVELDDKVNYLLEHDINLGYVEPFLFGTENTGRINLIQSRKLYSDSNELPTSLAQYNPPVTNPPYDFAFDNTQGDTLVERNLSKKLKLIYETYGIAYINYFEINNKVPAVPLQVATTGPSFVWDNRDDPFNPTRGNLSNLSLEFSSPFMGSTSTVNYYKAVLGHTQYFPLGKAVFANEGRIGYINNLSTAANSGVPALKAFRLGGDSTLRAFDPINEAIPNIIAFPAPNGIPIVPNESYFYLLKSEFRFPIIGNFGAAIFYDGGYVGLPGYSILYTPTFRWRDDVGLELLYNTPFGPVVVGYAQKLEQDQVLGEDSGRFLFSIGVF